MSPSKANRFLRLPMGLFACCALTLTIHAQAAGTAQAAYDEIQNNSFDTDRIEHAKRQLAQAEAQQPNDPWVHLAKGALILTEGFRQGSWLSASSFEPGTVDRSLQEVAQAIRLDPKMESAHYDLANLYVIKEDYKRAWAELDYMDKLWPNRESHWSLRAQVYRKTGDFANAEKMIARANQLATSSNDRTYNDQCLIEIAEARKDYKRAEQLYIEIIKMEPTSPHRWGNYGHFLLAQGRPKEAIPYLEHAIQLMPYGLAQQDLATAKAQAGKR